MGNPEKSFANYVYVDNVVDALYTSAINNKTINQIFIINDCLTFKEFIDVITRGLGKNNIQLQLPVLVTRIALFILNMFGLSIPLTQARINAMTDRRRYSISKAQKYLGYKNRITLDDGLTKVVLKTKCLT